MSINNKKTINFIVPSLKGGGAEKVLSIVLSRIDRNIFEPTLVLFRKEGDYLATIPPNIRIIDLDKRGRWDVFKLIFKMRKLIRKTNPDVLVSFLDYANVITVLSASFLRRKPAIIISERSYHRMYLSHSRMRFIRRSLMHYAYNKASKIIAISRGIKDAISEDFKIDLAKIDVVYNPVDIRRITLLKEEPVSHKFFENQDDSPALISVGRLDREKNFELLIRAFAEVRVRVPARLIILGQGKMEKELKMLAARLNVAEYVDFVSRLKKLYEREKSEI